MLTPDNNTNIRQPTDSSSVRSFGGDQRVTPQRPNLRKEFKKLLGNEDDSSENVEDEKKLKKARGSSSTTAVSEDSEEAQSQKPARPLRSPFFSDEQMQGDEIAMAAQSTVEELEKKTKLRSPFFPASNTPTPSPGKKASSPTTASPMNVYRQVAAEAQAEPQNIENEQGAAWAAVAQQSGGEAPIGPRNAEMKGSKEKFTTRFHDEHPDVAYVNPLVGGSQSQVNAVTNQTSTLQASSIAEIKEIIDRILDKLYTLETSGKTETVMEVKNLSLFEGARVILTEYKTATKEFNIAFENLRPDAKQLLDANLGTLHQALAESGRAKAVHIITTTTLIEHNFVVDAKPTHQQRNEDQQRQGEQQQQRREQAPYREEDEELA